MKLSKYFILLTWSLALSAALNGCGKTPDTPGKGQEKEPQKSPLEILCLETEGIFKDGRCVCNDIICDANMVCTPEGNCPLNLSCSCDAGTKKCTNNAVFECFNLIGWSKIQDCTIGCSDDDSFCAECYSTICKDGKLSVCESNKITTIDCQYGCNANNDDCQPECEIGEVKCSGKSRLTCNPETNTWLIEENCPVNCGLDKQGKTECVDDCTEYSTKCVDGTLYTCLENKWSNPVQCKFNGQCFNEAKCYECTVEDANNPPKRCFNDENQVGHIQVCNGSFFEDELIPSDPEDPNSTLVPNISADKFSCKENEAVFGECNNLSNEICQNYKYVGDDLGQIYTCKQGVLIFEESCSDRIGKKVSCNANSDGCGECINHQDNGCKNDEYGIGNVIKCVDGAWTPQHCSRDLPCRNDMTCDQCIYNAISQNNEAICYTNRRDQIFICQPDHTWKLMECLANEAIDKWDNHCKNSTAIYHDYCPGGYK